MVLCDDSVGKLWLFLAGKLTGLLQELFTREDPFYPVKGMVIMTKIFEGPPSRPSRKNTCGRFTDEWWNICSRCWHTEPPSRPTMAEVANKIEKIVCSSLATRLLAIDRWSKMTSSRISASSSVTHANGSANFNLCHHPVSIYK